jgi:tetrahydromethanopterin S-methyltransferase subunit A
LPVPAYNTFTEIWDSLEATSWNEPTPSKITMIRPNEFDSENWPIQPGDYHVVNMRKPVAVVLLRDAHIDKFHEEALSQSVAIVGSLNTENLGVEHVVKNIIANPFIRHVVIWGNDGQGHFPGDAIVKLAAHGTNNKQKIIAARGARPILNNIIHAEVEHFRKQVTIHDLIGVVEFTALDDKLRQLGQLEEQPYEAGIIVDLVEVIKAEPAKKLRLDPSGYFVIMAMKGKQYPLLVEHYTNDGSLQHIIKGEDAATIASTLIDMGLVSQLVHAAYLGRELARAEMSLKAGTKYVQDKAQGELQC